MKFALPFIICILQVFTSPVAAQCNAGFVFTAAENMVSFTQAKKDTLHTLHQWDFGDGVSSYVAFPIHFYKTSGEFKVRHWVYLQSGLYFSEIAFGSNRKTTRFQKQ